MSSYRAGDYYGASSLHGLLRVIQVLMLIPAWALLAAIVDHYNRKDTKTPGAITFLFVVALLASVWAFCVLITTVRARNTALWMSFFDIVAMALLIAAVVVLSDIANADCVAVTWSSSVDSGSISGGSSAATDYSQEEKWWNTRVLRRDDLNVSGAFTYRQHCVEVKTAWGLAIANIILFFFTALLAAAIYFENNDSLLLPVTTREKAIIHDDHAAAAGVPPPGPGPGHYHHEHRHRRHSGVAVPPPVFTEPYYGPPPAAASARRHSRSHRSGSHRSDSHRSGTGSYSHRSRHGSYYDGGSRRGSDHWV